MKVAVTYENNQVFQHFGHTEKFKIYEIDEAMVFGDKIEGGKIISSEIVDTNGSGHGALAGFLKEHDVKFLICGGIGGGAQSALAENGIKFFGGVTGDCDFAVESLLNGTLQYNPNVHCDHHDHEGSEHKCGEHGCGSHNDVSGMKFTSI